MVVKTIYEDPELKLRSYMEDAASRHRHHRPIRRGRPQKFATTHERPRPVLRGAPHPRNGNARATRVGDAEAAPSKSFTGTPENIARTGKLSKARPISKRK